MEGAGVLCMNNRGQRFCVRGGCSSSREWLLWSSFFEDEGVSEWASKQQGMGATPDDLQVVS